jgi:type I restriction enzyme R subunit
MSNFAFLQSEWPGVHDAALRAEQAAHPDPRAACFYARYALELAVSWMYQHDASLRKPSKDILNALINEGTFRKLAGSAIVTKAHAIRSLGNNAVHGVRPVHPDDALSAVRELFHVGYWLARTYARGERPADALAFDATALPRSAPVPQQTAAQLRKLEEELRGRDAKLLTLQEANATLDEALKTARAEIAAAKRENASRADTHDYSEEATRDLIIDLLLREAGWPLDQARDREHPVTGMPTESGAGRVDYVLWGDDGRPLALVEAKRTRRNAREGQQQAKLYADCLEKEFGRRPLIFYTNGYDHWLWDDAVYPPRPVQGFLKKPELELALQRRTTRKPLGEAKINAEIVERYYQTRAIRRIGEAFERDRQRKALVVMATGAGKTRTVIALADLLMRCNWAKRILFLADRKALVRQAANAFNKHLPGSSPVNLLADPEGNGRVFVSTYPTMMGLIDDLRGGERRFGVGHFDLIVVDEAHRSVFQKYRAIFDYFDALLVGLTATPKDELDRNTYSLFDLPSGMPTDAYTLDEAVADGFLVPPRAVSVPLKFQREGIRYDDLSEEEKDEWDALEWSEEGEIPDRVEAEELNRWLFNQDTVDQVLGHLMTSGLAVAGGDRLGKTIIFAKNQAHAEYIYNRFNKQYPHLAGHFARVITHADQYAQTLIDDFSTPEKAPHIAISVDMLDTGIDVPEVVNLVFFKQVRSKTKFWQMVGRGTRLAPDLFGSGEDKEFFYIFDYCQNLEYFRHDPPTVEASAAPPLRKRLFLARLELMGELDRTGVPDTTSVKEKRAVFGDPKTDAELRSTLTSTLHGEVASVNVDNFVVRRHRRIVEKYARPEAWLGLTPESHTELAGEIAGLPSQLEPEPEEAKRFDLLILHLQLAIVRQEPAFERLRDQVRTLAGALEDKAAIPMVKEHLELIQELQGDAWWEDVTLPMLELVRRRLRGLVRLIDREKRKPVYTNFADEMGDATTVELPGFSASGSFARFRDKAREFLRTHADHVAILKLRTNKALTPADLLELERMLVESGVGSAEQIERAKEEANGLGLFVRSMVGLDRAAAKEALGSFLTGKHLGANQIEFVSLVIDHLTEHGAMDAALLYESPFTDLTPLGPDGLFTSPQVDELVAVLERVNAQAAA